MDQLTAPYSRAAFRALAALLILGRSWAFLPPGAIAFHVVALILAGALAAGFYPRSSSLALLAIACFGDALALAKPLSLAEALASGGSRSAMASAWLEDPGRLAGAVALLWIAAFDASGSLERFDWRALESWAWLRGRRPSGAMAAAVFLVPIAAFASGGRWPQTTLAAGLALFGAHRPFRHWAGAAAAALVFLHSISHQTSFALFGLCAFAAFGKAWCPPARGDERPIALFAPERELYGRIVDLLIAEDRLRWIRFCPLGSRRAATELASRGAIDDAPFALKEGARLSRGSSALIKALESLGGWWRLAAYPLGAIPEAMREEALARLERRLDGHLSPRTRPTSEDERRRFLD